LFISVYLYFFTDFVGVSYICIYVVVIFCFIYLLWFISFLVFKV